MHIKPVWMLVDRFSTLLTNTHLPVRAQSITRITNTLEWAIDVDTFAICTHPCLRTFIQVHTECPIQWWCKAILTHTPVGSRYVFTATLQTDSCILVALINIWRKNYICYFNYYWLLLNTILYTSEMPIHNLMECLFICHINYINIFYWVTIF